MFLSVYSATVTVAKLVKIHNGTLLFYVCGFKLVMECEKVGNVAK